MLHNRLAETRIARSQHSIAAQMLHSHVFTVLRTNRPSTHRSFLAHTAKVQQALHQSRYRGGAHQ